MPVEQTESLALVKNVLFQAFWKYIEDIPHTGIKMRRQSKNLSTLSKKQFDVYFQNKERIERWMTAPDSEVYVMKPSDQFYLV